MAPLIVCITGGPRTGTHLLNSVLCTSDSVSPMLSESLPLIDVLAAWKRAASHSQSHGAALGVSLPEITELYAAWLKGLALRIAERFHKDVVVFRGPLLAQHIEALLPLLRECGLPYRVIAMVRWPPDAVASLAAWSAKLKSNGKGGPIVEDASAEGLARFWIQYYAGIIRLAEREGLPIASIKVVRYQDLVTSPRDVVQDIGSFLGIDLSAFDRVDGWRNSLVPYSEALGEFVTPLYGRPITPESEGEGAKIFSPQDMAAILNICRDIVTAYYPDRSERWT